MEERRRYARTSAMIRVELTNAAFGTIVGTTKDILMAALRCSSIASNPRWALKST